MPVFLYPSVKHNLSIKIRQLIGCLIFMESLEGFETSQSYSKACFSEQMLRPLEPPWLAYARPQAIPNKSRVKLLH